MSEEKFKFSVKNKVGVLTIDNPPANALGSQVRGQLLGQLQQIGQSDDILCLIITGAGKKFFAAGADINTMLKLDRAGGLDRVAEARCFFDTVAAFAKPVIAAINGICLGAGLELALACDIRLATENARLGLPEANLGLIPGGGGTQRLTREVGLGWANYLLLTGQHLRAAEAEKIGLIQTLVPTLELMPRAKQIAEQITSNGPLAVRVAKSVARQGLEMPLERGLDLENQSFAELCATRDKNEGVTAFLEKRAPKFQGR